MAIYHLLYRSTTAGAIPISANMPAGRLALNLTDERLYFSNAAGAVVQPMVRPHTHPASEITDLGSIFNSTSIGDGVDLNTYTTPGIYHQNTNSGAASGTNYPVALAGLLQVYAGGGTAGSQNYTYQVYTQYRGSLGAESRIFWRARYASITSVPWNNWQELIPSYQKGAANGVATLGADSKVPAAQLPVNLANSIVFAGSIPTSSDLNSYVERALWQVPASSIAVGGTNFPAPYSGYLLVMSPSTLGAGAVTSGVTQTYYAANSNNTWTRHLITSTWTSWVSTGNCAGLPVVAHDLNTYSSAGSFFQNSDAGATAGTNYPVANAGMLTVSSSTLGSNIMVTQEYVSLPITSPRIFRRIRFGSTPVWSGWKEITAAGNLTAQASSTDATTGRILVNSSAGEGSFGLGASTAPPTWPNTDLNLTTSLPATGFYRYTAGTNIPTGAATSGNLNWYRYDANNGFLFLDSTTYPSVHYMRRLSGGAWQSWQRLDPQGFGIGIDGNGTTIVDFNDQTILSGVYRFTGASLNPPDTITGSLGTVFVQRQTALYLTQIVIASSGIMTYRVLSNGTWGSWLLVATGVAVTPVATSAATTIALGTAHANTYTRTTATTAVTVNVAAGAGVLNTEYHFRQAAAGAITFTPASGVTINPPYGGSRGTAGVGSTVTLKCVATNVFDLFGQTGSA